MIGTIAGLALTAVAVPGLGALGLAGYLIGALGAGGFGATMGGVTGLAARVRLDHADRWCDIALGSEELLLVARAGDRAAQARAVMEHHGARCFLDTAERATGS